MRWELHQVYMGNAIYTKWARDVWGGGQALFFKHGTFDYFPRAIFFLDARLDIT